MGYLSFSMSTTSWLLFLSDSDWDVNIARTSYDFAGFLDQLKICYENADILEMAQEQTRKRKFWNENTTLSRRYQDKLHHTRAWYLSTTTSNIRPSTNLSGVQQDVNALPDIIPSDGLDPLIWESIMNDEVWGALSS
jgi:hypothetical protein